MGTARKILPVENQSEFVITYDDIDNTLHHIQTCMTGTTGWACRPTKKQLSAIILSLIESLSHMEGDE